jgi:hypothetical protein
MHVSSLMMLFVEGEGGAGSLIYIFRHRHPMMKIDRSPPEVSKLTESTSTENGYFVLCSHLNIYPLCSSLHLSLYTAEFIISVPSASLQ